MELNNDNFGSYSHRNSKNIFTEADEISNLVDGKKENNPNTSFISANKNINKNPYDHSELNLNSDFQNLIKKYETCSEDEKENFRKILNSFAILLECKTQLITKLFHYQQDKLKFNFNFFYRGKPKEISIRKGKDKFSFFEFLFQAYNKFIKSNHIVSNTMLDLNEIIYDLTGLPIVEMDLRNKLCVNKLIHGLKSLAECKNYILLAVNDEDIENPQICFQILYPYEQSNIIQINEYVIRESNIEQGNTNLNVNLDQIDDPSELNFVHTLNVLFKLRRFNASINLKTLYDYNYLLEARNQNIKECKELYPLGKSNYTYISLNEIFTTFTRILILENKKFEQQINGKFIKCKRDDDVLEYKSRWIYSFNVVTDNFEVTIGIHQHTPNTISPVVSYLYTGIVILRSNMSMLNFVDYIPIKDQRQNFIKLRLSRGSYVVVPITTGFYFSHPKEPRIDIEKILLIENKKDPKTKKTNYDFSTIAKNIIDDIFDKFDIYKEGNISLDKLEVFYKTAMAGEENFDFNELIKQHLDSNNELSLKAFRNFFFYLAKSKGEGALIKIFKKFGYSEIINQECRHFFMSFYTNEELEVKLSDGINNKFNSYAFELYLKHIGTIMNTNNNKYINLIYDQTRDSCNVILMLENKSDNEKRVTLDIESSGYCSINGFRYKNILKPRESKYLFPLAIDKAESRDMSQQHSYLIKYHIICE